MNAIRIYRHLDSVIPQLPELTPLVGRDVEIIALESGEALRRAMRISRFQTIRSLPSHRAAAARFLR